MRTKMLAINNSAFAHRVYGFRVILRINGDYFLKQH
jgi:hypothetical protein